MDNYLLNYEIEREVDDIINSTSLLTILAFFLTMVFIFWRPRGLNEAIPATIGAFLVFISGSVTMADLGEISSNVTGAAITIIATLVMAIALESFGFFHWMAAKLLERSKGSGIRLFWLTNLLCFFMTLFLNNDGSILVTTPILLLLLNYIGLKNHQKLPYLISGALIATASSAPIGVSNIVNLISLEMIGMDLYLNTIMMFVPGTLGLLFLSGLLFGVFYKKIPKKISYNPRNLNLLAMNHKHPFQTEPDQKSIQKQKKVMVVALVFVFLVRISLFIASYAGISVPLVAVIGSATLLGWRWYYLKINPRDMFKKTPWYILIFAFSMYVLIFGLHNIGLTEFLVNYLEPVASNSLFHVSLTMGTIISILSNVFNNHPALMVGTLTITQMGLDPLTLKTIYLATIIGSDIGSLLLPIGTLATLMWINILKERKVKIFWKDYLRVTFIVIPPTVLFTLICLYLWISWIFI